MTADSEKPENAFQDVQAHGRALVCRWFDGNIVEKTALQFERAQSRLFRRPL
jgi:uncharacterized protein YodC (DUF2158 family)